MYKKILIPLDGSKRAEAVLTQVNGLLEVSDAEVVLLSVVEIPEVEQGHLDVVGGARDVADRYLDGLTFDLGSRVSRKVVIGDPAAEILRVAQAEGVELIAMASHGYRGVARLFYGSTSERVLRASPAAVLVLRSFHAESAQDGGDASRADSPEVSEILVPLDGSKGAEAVLPDAVSLARQTGAVLHLVRVRPGFPATPFYAPSPELIGNTDAEQGYLANIAAYLQEDGIAVETATPVGAVAEQLRIYMADHDIDLLAMTTHGRSGLQRWLLGSTAEELLRQSRKPILVRRINN